MKTEQVDGNDIQKVYECISKVKSSQKKKSEPFLVEALTFRMRGHEEASGTKYYPDGLQEKWKKKDPILKLEISYKIKIFFYKKRFKKRKQI